MEDCKGQIKGKERNSEPLGSCPRGEDMTTRMLV